MINPIKPNIGLQWRSQPQIFFGGPKYLILGE